MNKRELTWRHLKALNELYVSDRTTASILDNGYIKNVLLNQKKLITYKSGNIKFLVPTHLYQAYYEETFRENYNRYETFLKDTQLETDSRRKYSENDIQTLMFIASQKNELKNNLSTIRTFSSKIFKGMGSKYLENKPGLKHAVCQILEIADFPEKDPKNLQWRLVIDCINPNSIVLCENIAHLKNPWKAIENSMELWYVGGNNINMIDRIDPEKLSKPLYYSCDWDYHGLSIYSRIKKKISDKGHSIELLIPNTYDHALPVNSPHHYSKWDFNSKMSGLRVEDFPDVAIPIIERLIREDKWIEEESLDLIDLV